jgi:hypothetical protein
MVAAATAVDGGATAAMAEAMAQEVEEVGRKAGLAVAAARARWVPWAAAAAAAVAMNWAGRVAVGARAAVEEGVKVGSVAKVAA